MNNMELRYSVGALLYSPALNRKITTSVLSGQFGNNYSIALCLEDTIADSAVGHTALNGFEALENLAGAFFDDKPSQLFYIRNGKNVWYARGR